MKKILLICVVVLNQLGVFAQIKTWNGSINTDWYNESNWTPSSGATVGPPSAVDSVIINTASNQPIISSGNASARSVRLNALSTFSVNAGASLTVSSSAVTCIQMNNAVLTNNGTITLDNNNALEISGQAALLISFGGTFNNFGTLSISSLQNDAIVMAQANFNNESGGQVSGIGKRIIRFTNSNAFFTNKAGSLLAGTGFTNAFTVVLGKIINSGRVDVVGSVEVTSSNSEILNNSCGIMIIVGDLFVQSSSTFDNNSGYLLVTGLLNNNATFRNRGPLKYGSLSGSNSINNSSTAIIINNLSSTIFTYGGPSYAGTINGIFTDTAATLTAGIFTAPNNFISTVGTPGIQTLYAKISPNICSGAFFIVPFLYDVPIMKRYAKTEATGTGDGSSWANAGTLQAMINVSRVVDSVWVAAGVYKPLANGAGTTNPSDVRTRLFYMRSGVKIFGGFNGTETSLDQRDFKTNKTILSADIDNNDTNIDGNNIAESHTNIQGNNAYQLMVIANCNKNTVVDGFIFTGAKSSTSSTASQPVNGSSILSKDGAALVILFSYPTIRNCIFSGNFGNSFGNFYQNNELSAPYVDTVKVINSIFTGNYALFGGGLFIRRGHHYANNIVLKNNSSSTGGSFILHTNMDPTGVIDVINSTLIDNYTTSGKTIQVQNGNLKLLNSIVFNAVPYSGGNVNQSAGTISSSFSLLQNSTTAAVWNGNYGTDNGGNFNGVPMFLDTSDVDGVDNLFFTEDDGFIPAENSAMINRGTNTGIIGEDITHRVRPYSGGTTDVGAYEYHNGDPTTKYTKSIATGNWETSTTWNTGAPPQAGEIVIIDQNHTVTLSGVGHAKDIQINNLGKLILSLLTSNLNLGM